MQRVRAGLSGMKKGLQILKERNDRQKKKIQAGGNTRWKSCEQLDHPLPPCLQEAQKQAELFREKYLSMQAMNEA